MNVAEARKLWHDVVDELIENTWHGVDMLPIILKLKRLKFTYGGEMKADCNHSSYKS